MNGGHMEFYFPATILLQYVPAFTIDELKSLSKEEAVKLYTAFNKPSDEDVESHFYLPPSYRELFFKIRNRLRGKYLGSEVKLFFSLNKDITTPEITLEELDDYIIVDVEKLKQLKLKKAKIIERILFTDIVFRLYYHIYDKIADELKQIRDLKEKICYLPLNKSYQLNVIEKEFFAYSKESSPIKVHYPEQMRGFKSVCFPLLTWSQLTIFGIQYIIIHDSNSFNLNPPDDFVKDCEVHFDRDLERYKARLKGYVTAVSQLIDGKDPLEDFILSNLPRSELELYTVFEHAKELGYNTEVVIQKFSELRRKGRVYLDTTNPNDPVYKVKE